MRKRLENLLRQQVNPDNLTVVLGRVEVAEAPSVYRLVEIHATKLCLDEIASSAGKVVLQLCVTFQTAEKAIKLSHMDTMTT